MGISDRQPITEASYVSIPVIAFCNTDSPQRYVDIAVPCNNRSPHSIGLMWWMLAREVLRLRGTISRNLPWETDVMPDLFFFRDAEDQEKEEAAKAEAPKVEAPPAENWGADVNDPDAVAAAAAAAGAAAPAADGAAVPAAAAVAAAPAAAVAAPAAAAVVAAAPAAAPVDDWGQAGDDWASPATGTDGDWGGAADGANW